jgi:RecA/RadA recombinase
VHATAPRLPCLQGLDAALRVGVPAGAITELVGPAGVGKSQMAMGLALSAALPRELGGLAATVMYIGEQGRGMQGGSRRLYGSQRLG